MATMRPIVLVLALCLTACSPGMHRAYRTTVTAAACGAYAVDSWQTHQALAAGAAVEMNPIMRPVLGERPGALRSSLAAAGGMGLIVVTGRLIERLPNHQPGAEWLKDALATVPFLVEGVTVAWNDAIANSGR